MMKTLIALAFTIASPSGGEGGALGVEFQLREPGGAVRLAVYGSREAYEAGRPLHEARAEAREERVSVAIPSLADGEYAIAAYHDVNDDGRLNSNLFGQPIEPTGFSNDAAPRRGPPSWDEVRFRLGAERHPHSITLQ